MWAPGVVASTAAAVAAAVAAFAPRVVAALAPRGTTTCEPEDADQPAERYETDEPDGSAGPTGRHEPTGPTEPVTPSPPGPDETDAVASPGYPAPSAGEAPVDWPGLAGTRGLAARSAVGAGVIAGSVALVLGPDASVPAWTALAVLGTWLAWIDWRTRLLPRRLVVPAYGVVGVLLLAGGLLAGDGAALIRSALGWLGVFGLYATMWLVHPRGLGYGDVRLSGVLGMALGWLGWPALVVGIYAGFLLGAVGGALLVLAGVVDRRGYPFGPFMLAGTWLGVLTSPWTAGWL